MAEDPKAGAQKAAMSLEDIITLLSGQLGEANLQSRALKTALIKDGADIGRHDAVVAFASGVGGAGGTVEVKHQLRRAPGYIRLLTVISAAGVGAPYPHVSVCPVQYEKWTDTTARVDLYLIGAGSMDGVIVVLEVGGERVA